MRDGADGQELVELRVVGVVAQERAQREGLAASTQAYGGIDQQQRERRHEEDHEAQQHGGGVDVRLALARLRLGGVAGLDDLVARVLEHVPDHRHVDVADRLAGVDDRGRRRPRPSS